MARFWVHNGFLMVEGQKMSKSLGNFLTVRQLLGDFQGEVIRLALLSTHYRQPIDFTRDGLRHAKQTLDRFYGVLRAAAHLPVTVVAPPDTIVAALCDDLNTPKAIALFHEMVTAITTAKNDAARATARDQFLAAGLALGLLQQDAELWLHWQPAGAGMAAEQIETLILARQQARKDKNFAESDRIRDELLAAGIMLEDGPKGTIWRRAG